MFFYLFDVHGLWFVVSESSVDLQQKIEQNETRFRKQNKKRVTKNVILKNYNIDNNHKKQNNILSLNHN